jgi:DNA-binding phage protein
MSSRHSYERSDTNREQKPDKLIATLTTVNLTDEQKQYIDGHRKLLDRGKITRSTIAKKLGITRLMLNHYLQQKAEWSPMEKKGGVGA